jgi:hypothetical protein
VLWSIEPAGKSGHELLTYISGNAERVYLLRQAQDIARFVAVYRANEEPRDLWHATELCFFEIAERAGQE